MPLAPLYESADDDDEYAESAPVVPERCRGELDRWDCDDDTSDWKLCRAGGAAAFAYCWSFASRRQRLQKAYEHGNAASGRVG